MAKKSSKKMSNKQIAWICIGVIALIAIAVAAGVLIYKLTTKEELPPEPNSPALESEPPYADGSEALDREQYKMTKVWVDVEIDELITNIKNKDEQKGAYQLIIRKEGSDECFEVNYWTENGKGIYEYIFGGYDMGIDLDGVYYRTVIDSVPTIIDYRTGEFHTSGEFFDKYMSALSAITLDSLMSDILSEGFIELGENKDGNTVVTSGKVSICVTSDEVGKVTAIDENGDAAIGYYIAYGLPYTLPNIDVD